MDEKGLEVIIDKHKKWLNDEDGGERADLQEADLRWADLQEADLRWADLQGANLRGANLRRAGLEGADLRRANLQEADLQGAGLRGANIDFSCWPLWCGSLDVKVDKRAFSQLAYHLCRVKVDDDECKAAQRALAGIANKSHRVDQCGRIEFAPLMDVEPVEVTYSGKN